MKDILTITTKIIKLFNDVSSILLKPQIYEQMLGIVPGVYSFFSCLSLPTLVKFLFEKQVYKHPMPLMFYSQGHAFSIYNWVSGK